MPVTAKQGNVISIELTTEAPASLPPLHNHLLCMQVLQPGIELAEEGFPVAPVTAYHWKATSMELRGPGKAAFLNPEGNAPGAGEIQRNPDLGATFRSVAEHGALEGDFP